MATGANKHNEHYGNHQWNTTTTNTTNGYYPNTLTGTGSITYTYPNHKEDLKNAKKLKPLPKIDYVEFGGAYDVAVTTIATNPDAIKQAYQMALDDFFKSRAENFPTWESLPEIKVDSAVDSLRRMQKIGWYVRVPKMYVLDKEQIEEDKLWNS